MATMREIQSQIAEWSQRNFGDNLSKAKGITHSSPLGSLCALLGVMEELGELVHCVLKRHQGIRGYDEDIKYQSERDDAVADLMVYLNDFSAREGIDLFGVFSETWKKVQQRDWQKNPHLAHQVAESEPINSEVAMERAEEMLASKGPDAFDIPPEHREHGNIQSSIQETEIAERIRQLRKFKTFVHERLDQMGVPKEFPEGKHSKEGCRIGDRLDWVEKVIEAFIKAPVPPPAPQFLTSEETRKNHEQAESSNA